MTTRRTKPVGRFHRESLAICLLELILATRGVCGPASADQAADSGAKFDSPNEQLDAEVAALSARLEKSPNSVELYSRRGDALFFRGRFADATRDFDKMVELRPDLDRSHWRRGIAYFYAERYADAAAQFERYHAFDNIDRENGIWRYLSQVKAVGQDKAREGLLKYEKDDREPFPDVYRMFAGDLTGVQVLDRIRATRLPADERDRRLFYAELYVGLNEFVAGRSTAAEEHLRAAVENPWGAKATGGPGWMWHVARLHHERLRAGRKSPASSR